MKQIAINGEKRCLTFDEVRRFVFVVNEKLCDALYF